MTDGTTGIQVAPISEDDMNKLQSIFQRALDAIVSMSKLAGEVETLRQQVGQLTDDAERLRRANAGLDESLYQARNQRLDLERKLAEAEQAKATAQRECSDWQSKANSAEAKVNELRNENTLRNNELEESQYRVIELEDKLKAAEAKVGAIHAALGITPAPEVPPAPPPSVGPVVQPTPEASPTPVPEVAEWPGPTPPTPTRQYFDTWQPGSMWDDDRRQYYID